jgi:hypothetical protein
MGHHTRAFALIAADLLSGLAVDVAQPVQVVAHEHPMDRRSRNREATTQAVGPELLLPADLADPFFDPGRGALGRAPAPRGPVEETVRGRATEPGGDLTGRYPPVDTSIERSPLARQTTAWPVGRPQFTDQMSDGVARTAYGPGDLGTCTRPLHTSPRPQLVRRRTPTCSISVVRGSLESAPNTGMPPTTHVWSPGSPTMPSRVLKIARDDDDVAFVT